PALIAAVERGLEPAPAQRYPDADAFETALHAVQEAANPPAHASRQSRSPSWKVVATASTVLGSVALGAIVFLWSAPGIPWTRAGVEQLTFVGDAERFAISSDGSQIAYLRGVVTPGRLGQEIWVHDIAAGTDRVVFPKDPQWGFQALSFTPDSRGLYVVGQAMGREEVEPATFYEVSLSGGPP